MAYAVFSHAKISIGIETSIESDIEWLHEFFHPALSITPSNPDVTIQEIIEPDLYHRWLSYGGKGNELKTFMLDTEVIAFPEWSVPVKGTVVYDRDHKLFYHVDGDRIIILREDQKVVIRTRLMRVVREIVMGVSQSTGSRLLHASAFSLDGKALIVTGPKQAGKTSLLAYALNSRSADYLTNDRLLVTFKESKPRLSSIPTIVSVRRGTLDLFPELQKQVIDKRYRLRSTIKECQEADAPEIQYRQNGNLGISPAQWCGLFNARSVSDVSAGCILFPVQTGDPGGLSIKRLAVKETAKRLLDCMFGYIKPDSLSEVFTIIPPEVKKEVPMNDETFALRLAKSVAAYECQMGVDTYKNNNGIKIFRSALLGAV